MRPVDDSIDRLVHAVVGVQRRLRLARSARRLSLACTVAGGVLVLGAIGFRLLGDAWWTGSVVLSIAVLAIGCGAALFSRVPRADAVQVLDRVLGGRQECIAAWELMGPDAPGRATRPATGSPTGAATESATGAATESATGAATESATGAATESATAVILETALDRIAKPGPVESRPVLSVESWAVPLLLATTAVAILSLPAAPRERFGLGVVATAPDRADSDSTAPSSSDADGRTAPNEARQGAARTDAVRESPAPDRTSNVERSPHGGVEPQPQPRDGDSVDTLLRALAGDRLSADDRARLREAIESGAAPGDAASRDPADGSPPEGRDVDSARSARLRADEGTRPAAAPDFAYPARYRDVVARYYDPAR